MAALIRPLAGVHLHPCASQSNLLISGALVRRRITTGAKPYHVVRLSLSFCNVVRRLIDRSAANIKA
jgi:hypothetical protein